MRLASMEINETSDLYHFFYKRDSATYSLKNLMWHLESSVVPSPGSWGWYAY